MESNHLNKPVYRSKKHQKTKTNKQTKPICESNHKNKEKQKGKCEYVKRDIKIIQCGKEENLDFFFRMCLSLYDYRFKQADIGT